MSLPEQYCMKWNNYQSHIGSYFANLLESEGLVDVTLCAEGQKFYCHRVILSACSTYFQEILSNAESKHPIILLPGISPTDVKAIINFMYHGELNNVNYDNFKSILKTAETLKICGLMEVIDHLPPRAECNAGDTQTNDMKTQFDTNIDTLIEMEDEKEHVVVGIDSEIEPAEEHLDFDNYSDVKRKKQRRDSPRKYNEGSLAGALSDMKQGMPLVEAARLHKIPRSTLYAKAKQETGLNLVTRKEHSNQDCQAAIQAVAEGMSLQRASEEYGIPKTVLWRRVQKRRDISSSISSRKKINKCPPHIKEAAIKALTSGEKLVNIAAQFQIPLSTLFKEKSRLLENGTLVGSGGNKFLKQVRLSQAVAACKEGKMSQATASSTFQVPKTTIWRRLQKGGRNNEEIDKLMNCSILKDEYDISDKLIEEKDEVTSELAYMSSDEFTNAPLIIIANEPGLDLTDAVCKD